MMERLCCDRLPTLLLTPLLGTFVAEDDVSGLVRVLYVTSGTGKPE